MFNAERVRCSRPRRLFPERQLLHLEQRLLSPASGASRRRPLPDGACRPVACPEAAVLGPELHHALSNVKGGCPRISIATVPSVPAHGVAQCLLDVRPLPVSERNQLRSAVARGHRQRPSLVGPRWAVGRKLDGEDLDLDEQDWPFDVCPSSRMLPGQSYRSIRSIEVGSRERRRLSPVVSRRLCWIHGARLVRESRPATADVSPGQGISVSAS